MKYRNKPVVIEAIQWTGDNLDDVFKFTGEKVLADKWRWEDYFDDVKKKGIKILTEEGIIKISINDWIIKGDSGELNSCKPDIFETTYEPVE